MDAVTRTIQGGLMEARIKRSLPPAPEPTKPPEQIDKETARALAQYKYSQTTCAIKHKNTRRKRI
jgi:hypothetical protein